MPETGSPAPPGQPYSVVRRRPGDGFAAGGAEAALELCDLFQRSAGEHAERLGCSIEALNARGLTWVLLRLDLAIEPGADWRGPLEVVTWPSSARGLFALRDFLARGGGGAIARATSAWCVLDLASRRPARLPDVVRSIVAPERPRALERPFRRPPAPADPERMPPRRVTAADLDLNRHVNHVRYLRWALETLPTGWREPNGFAGLEAEFLAETSLGDEISTEVERLPYTDGATEARHRLVDAAGREIVRMRSRWRGGV